MEPKERFESILVIDEIAEKLNLPSDELYQGDWAYVHANRDSIDLYIDFYKSVEIDDKTDDKKYVLMQMMLQAVDDQRGAEKLEYYWNIVSNLIRRDFSVHEYLLWYWCTFDNDNMDENWTICPYCRTLWTELKN